MRGTRKRVVATVLCAWVWAGCQQDPVAADLGERLQAVLDAEVESNDAVRSAALHVDSPMLEFVWEGAVGVADPLAGREMTPATPVRIASNTKTFVAATILRLQEEGKLDIDHPIIRYLPEEFVETLESDGYDPTAITVRHLLTHTSGLFDPTSLDRYTDEIIADPNHHWTRAEQLQKAVDWGDPHGQPGVFYTYCDVGYGLLGAIIESASGQQVAAAARSLLGYEELGLDATWWETFEPEPEGVPDRAHQFYGDVDSYAFHPSYDLYGGGGIVSTVGDLARFYRALFTGGVFANPGTAAVMLTTIDGVKPLEGAYPLGYSMGIWVVEIEGFTTYRHTGFFGTLATYVPELDLVVTATTNQTLDGGAKANVAEKVIRMAGQAR